MQHGCEPEKCTQIQEKTIAPRNNKQLFTAGEVNIGEYLPS